MLTRGVVGRLAHRAGHVDMGGVVHDHLGLLGLEDVVRASRPGCRPRGKWRRRGGSPACRVARLSTMATSWPRARRLSLTCEAMKPAPPVTRIFTCPPRSQTARDRCGQCSSVVQKRPAGPASGRSIRYTLAAEARGVRLSGRGAAW